MAMMAKMRSLAPAFILTVGALFVLFMVISDSNVLEALGGRTNNVGSINGQDISYQEFSNAVEQQREMQKKQTGKDIDDENMDQFRDQVWESIINETLLQQETEKYNISVSDEEIRNVILSDDPPQFLKQNFIDSTGKFNRQLYESAIYDPRNKGPLLQAEDAVRQTLLNQKLQSMLLATAAVSQAEVKRRFIENNQKLNVQYAFIDLYQFPDSLFNITDQDLKVYYNHNLGKFEVAPQRKIKYVLFANKATEGDSLRVRNELASLKEDILKGSSDFKESVTLFSESPYRKDTLKLSQLPPSAAKLIYEEKKDSAIIGPVPVQNGYAIYEKSGTVSSNETQVLAYHILVNKYGNDEKNYEEAMKIYNELKNGANFEKLAKEKSDDKGSAVRGGDLGWFGKGIMVAPFERAAFNGPIGVIQKPLKTEFGYHIIKVLGKTSKKYIVANIFEEVKPSPTTVDANFNAAQDFSYIAEKNEFESEANLMNYKVNESLPFYKNSISVPGISDSKNLVDFAFNNELNDISEAIKVSNGYVVAKISEVKDQSVKSLETVKGEIKPIVLREKRFEKAHDEAVKIKSRIGSDLMKASSINPKIQVRTTGNFPARGPIPIVGNDYAFIAKAQELPLNKISDPLKGQKGYYLLNVLERTPFDSSAFDIQQSAIRNQILQQKKNTFFNEWITELRKSADIDDNRSQFYNR